MVLAWGAIGLIFYIVYSIYHTVRGLLTPYDTSVLLAEEGLTVTRKIRRKSYDLFASWEHVTSILVYIREDDGGVFFVIYGAFTEKLTGQVGVLKVGINNDAWYSEEVEEGPFETFRRICPDKIKFV